VVHLDDHFACLVAVRIVEHNIHVYEERGNCAQVFLGTCKIRLGALKVDVERVENPLKAVVANAIRGAWQQCSEGEARSPTLHKWSC